VHADVAIVGGGIIGCALAAFLAEDGARVRLYEREEVAAGASGRNSGLLQHPMDEALTDIFAASEGLYAELGHGFELPPEVVGVLVVGEDAAALEPIRAEIAGQFPELAAEAVDAPHELEPALAEDLAAFRLDTGRPVPPAAATRAFAARAREAGAEIREGVAATPVVEGGRAVGVARRRGRSPPARSSSPPARGAPRSSTRAAPGGRSCRRGASTSSSASPTRPATRSRKPASRA
jgi:glycine/D-amino acid oxidase-like deaminating enzyme